MMEGIEPGCSILSVIFWIFIVTRPKIEPQSHWPQVNVSSTYLSHIDDFSDIDPNTISLKYSTYMLANTGDNGEPIATLFSDRYISEPINGPVT